MLKHVKGNLLDLAEYGNFDVIVHGCNCQNVMGGGIAKEIRRRYPFVYMVDSAMHDDDLLNKNMLLGNFSWTTNTGNYFNSEHNFKIVNAYTQYHYIPRGIDHFNYDSFSMILHKLSTIWPNAHYGFPYIGMGLAGGNSFRIMKMLEYFAFTVEKTGGDVTLVEFK